MRDATPPLSRGVGETRRGLIAGLACLSASPSLAAPPQRATPRVVALEWAFASTLVAMGLPPAGVAEPDLYKAWVAEPVLPLGTFDVGLRTQPNLERVAALKPDLVLLGALSEPARPALASIAEVVGYNPFTPARRPLEAVYAYTRDIGRRLGRPDEAEALLARTDASFEAARAALAARAGRGLLVVSLRDERHVGVYGRGSLFNDVLDRLGIANVWDRATTIWGTSAAGVEALAAYPDADLVLLEPLPPGTEGLPARPGLWASLAALRRGRVVTVPAAWVFGDAVAAARFATLLARALTPDAPR